MVTSGSTLARVDWQLGQALLPEHFVAQEDSLLADVRQRFRLLGLPMYGIGAARWNEALLADGTLSVQALTLLLPNGQLFDVPGNAVIGTANLNAVGASRVTIHLHVSRERARAPEARGGEFGEEQRPLARVLHTLRLTPDPTEPDALFSMRFAEFVKDTDGLWSLSPDVIPPLVQIGASPFLRTMIQSLSELLEQLHFRLEQQIAASFLGGEGLWSAKLCLRSTYRLRRLLRNLQGSLRLHPYHLYEALKTFYVDLCLYKDVTPEDVDGIYEHDHLARCIGRVARPMVELIQLERARTPYVSFERRGGLCVLDPLPREARRADELYLLLQRPKVGTRLVLDGLKLAAPSRLPIVHQLALQGVPFERVERPPFQHQFGPEVAFFRLREGEEWDHVLRQGQLAFFDRAELGDVRAFLYWRNA